MAIIKITNTNALKHTEDQCKAPCMDLRHQEELGTLHLKSTARAPPISNRCFFEGSDGGPEYT